MKDSNFRIVTNPDDLKEGLFGQVLLFVFEILPYLEEKGFRPQWQITSKLYGTEPDYSVLPGVFDVAYEQKGPTNRAVSLSYLRDAHISVLGGNWDYMHRLWHSYFTIPPRISAAADAVSLNEGTLGLHFRGTDKNQNSWDTNPVSQDDFLTLTSCFISERPGIQSVFLATDEYSFVEKARRRLAPLEVRNLGEVGFHKSSTNIPNKADRALLDCILLSRCRYVIKHSSALSAFAKVLNPQLDVFRVAASKLFSDIPYFPEAYVPRLSLNDPTSAAILDRTFKDDWMDNQEASARFGPGFTYARRLAPLEVLRNRIKRAAKAFLKR